MNENFTLFMPLSKIDKDTRTVSGYASTPALDLDDEIVSIDAVRKALPGYMQWRNIRSMHTNNAVGVAKDANIDAKGLFLTAKIVDDDAWKKCVEGVYKGYSIGGKKLAKTGNTITEIELVEISIVDRPANPECRFDVHKGGKTPPAFLTKLPKLKKADSPLTDPGNKEVSDPPIKCAAHGLTNCDQGCCAEHGAQDCQLCAMGKREFTSQQRQSAAASGAALPDGSFPIKNKDDLSNARQAVGRAKDPSKARAHIRSRAQALGVTLPDNWKKKLAKRLIAAAEDKLFSLEKTKVVKSESAVPSFLTLTADGENPRLAKSVGRGHAGDLGEGGLIPDQSFLTLTRKGVIMDKEVKIDDNDLAKALLAVLSKSKPVTKAGRMEMARGDIKKARGAVKDIEACMKSLHAMHKASYLSKVSKAGKGGKKPASDDDADDNPFDHQGAMEKLQKGFGTLQMVKTLIKSANVQLKKAASRSGQREQEVGTGNDHYQVPMGVKELAPGDLDTAGGGSAPFVQGMVEPFPGKAGKSSMKKGMVSTDHAEALARAAAAEAKVEILESMPGGPPHGRRPAAFDLTKINGGDKSEAAALMKGVDIARLHDPDTNRGEVGKMIGNMILGGHGRSVFDGDFRGSAGVKS